METFFGIILIIAIYVSYRVSSNKGYSGVLFGIGAFFFPILALIVFALPDKSQAAKKAEINRAFDESMQEQQRKIDEMSARIRELENQQKEPAQPEVEEKPVQKEFAGRKVNLNVESEGDLVDLIVEIEHAESCYKKKMYFLALPYFEKAAKAKGYRGIVYR